MKLEFDLDQDELPIYLAETDEQVQLLDEGLIRLEQEGEEGELVQTLFRAAHTLKGAAGMIGHKRMVRVTHALENALDGIRKGDYTISTRFIDLCLEAVDALRVLRNEVVFRETSDIEVESLAERFNDIHALGQNEEKVEEAPQSSSVETEIIMDINQYGNKDVYQIFVKISKESFASAARALQVVLSLQSLGEIKFLDPSQDVIETAKPVTDLKIMLVSESSQAVIEENIRLIDEVESIEISMINVEPEVEDESQVLYINIEIADDAIASAARAYQVYLALESSGQIKTMRPSKEEIETANPVSKVYAELISNLQSEDVKRNLSQVDDLSKISVKRKGEAEQPIEKPVEPEKVKKVIESGTPKPQQPQNVATPEKMIRTSVERMDNLMNLVGELITDRNRLNQIRQYFEGNFRGNEEVDSLSETINHIARITDQLQNEVMGIRMSPISNVFHKFPRMIRDLARKFDKDVELIIQGEDTELDRTVIEEISDPLIHLLRNSIDHGIENKEERVKVGKPEKAKILLDAKHEEGRITITVEDDGRGVNTNKIIKKAIKRGLITENEAAVISEQEAVNLIFISGFSTADNVSDISGRGVGLDIVRNNVQRLNGTIQIETWPGEGTRFQINLPLTLAIVPTLLVKSGPSILAVPLIAVSTTLRISNNEIKKVNNMPVTIMRDKVLPLLRLSDVFKIKSTFKSDNYHHVVVIGSGKQQIGLIVDRLLGQEEVVVKSLGKLIGDVFGISSAAILGDGQVALIIDVQDLFRYSN